MVTSFQLAKTPKILFGEGALETVPREINSFGKEALIITGKSSFDSTGNWPDLQEYLQASGITWHHAVIDREPSPEMVDKIADIYRETGIEAVVAIGGGSVIDGGKAISAMIKHEGSVKNYLEGVGNQKPTGKKVPFIAVPTTAGTGSEATKNAVLSEIGPKGFKKSLRHERFVPDVAIVDPGLSVSCPPHVTAASGMDAFTQLLESYLSTDSSPITDSLALDGLRCIKAGLLKAYENGNHIQARGCVAYAAMISGMTLANAGLGVVHGFASSVGGKFDIPHGVICASLMGPTNSVTLEYVRKDSRYASVLGRYAEVGKIFSEEKNRSDHYYTDFLIELIQSWSERMEIPDLSQYGLKKADVPGLVEHTGQKNHPVNLSDEEMESILLARITS